MFSFLELLSARKAFDSWVFLYYTSDISLELLFWVKLTFNFATLGAHGPSTGIFDINFTLLREKFTPKKIFALLHFFLTFVLLVFLPLSFFLDFDRPDAPSSSIGVAEFPWDFLLDTTSSSFFDFLPTFSPSLSLSFVLILVSSLSLYSSATWSLAKRACVFARPSCNCCYLSVIWS